MKFRILRSTLLAELGLLRAVVEKKDTILVLTQTQLCIEARKDGSLTLDATDLDVTLSTTIDASVERPGVTLVSANRLYDVVRSLPEAEITFSHDEAKSCGLKVTCAGSEFSLATQEAEHFPTTPAWKDQMIGIPAETLGSLIERTAFAITTKESRYALNGALFQIKNATLTLVATDGYRLALASAHGLPDGGAKVREIVPKKALAQISPLIASLVKSLSKDDEKLVGFATDATHLFFDFGRRRLISRMLADQFPDYNLVLPNYNDKVISIPTEAFSQAVKRTALMADERSHGIKLEIAAGTVSLTAQSSGVGESKDSLPIDYAGETLGIGFNADYLLDFLTEVGSERVTLALKDEHSPALFIPEDGSDYRYVVIPMRLL